jgi:hypothetical protein
MILADPSMHLLRREAMRRVVTCCAVLLALNCGTAAWAETEFKEKTVGDWRGVENAWQHADELSGREFGPWAWTNALDGREGIIGIISCGQYSVRFSFQGSQVFGTEDSPRGSGDYRIIYGRVLPAESVLEPIMLDQGDMEYFYFDAGRMMRAGKFLLCPTNEENSDCVTYSLRGFTAALKMICPKR